MPEGDTVFRLAERLRRSCDGKTVESGELRVPRFATAVLAGRRISGHDTWGKHLLTRFDDSRTLHTHLRMDGEWSVVRAGRRLPPRIRPDIRVRLGFSDGTTAYGIRLPVVELIPTRAENDVLGHLGPDPLRTDWSAEEAVRRMSADPTRALSAALLDQRVIAGLGNLWANELCFLVGAGPWTPVGEVDLPALVGRAAAMLRRSAAGPGPTQVTTDDPRPGRQHWVAGRAHRPCRRCGGPVRVVAEVPGDPGRRRTWWCPRCQPGPPPPV